MSLPRPRAGLVIRYAFLWSHQAGRGRTEGRKDRPAAIVVATRKEPGGEVRVVVAPITHEPPADPAASVEIPATALPRKRSASMVSANGSGPTS